MGESYCVCEPTVQTWKSFCFEKWQALTRKGVVRSENDFAHTEGNSSTCRKWLDCVYSRIYICSQSEHWKTATAPLNPICQCVVCCKWYLVQHQHENNMSHKHHLTPNFAVLFPQWVPCASKGRQSSPSVYWAHQPNVHCCSPRAIRRARSLSNLSVFPILEPQHQVFYLTFYT